MSSIVNWYANFKIRECKTKKLDQTIKPRLKSKSPLNNTEFYYINNSDNDSELGWYWYDSLDSLDNEYSDSGKEERGEKNWESNKEEPIILPSLSFVRLAKLS